ncbi:hypothetical protein E2C01_062800 [Portunus trituberculatus]|uniref:Uncharacterized protein n=1 Tax=Portunus trituberculatus TaxID=210409 RepID=A0A5B7HIC1_PORTR|nr:hypothetical protein [Portunus trituberculatus]
MKSSRKYTHPTLLTLIPILTPSQRYQTRSPDSRGDIHPTISPSPSLLLPSPTSTVPHKDLSGEGAVSWRRFALLPPSADTK